MENTLVSVIIPVRNGASTIARCIAAIQESDYPQIEIIVADDHSAADTASIAAEAGAVVVRLEDAAGVSAARNTGARAANGGILLFTDADVFIHKNTISAIVGRIISSDAGGAVGLFTERASFGNFSSDLKNLWMRYTYERLPDDIALFFTSIAAIQKDTFEASGGFDEKYASPSVEDTAFGRKLAGLGAKILLCREAEATHCKRYSASEYFRTNFFRASALVRLYIRELAGPKTDTAKSSAAHRKFSVPPMYPLGAAAMCSSIAVFILGIFISGLQYTLKWLTDLYVALMTLHHVFYHLLKMPFKLDFQDSAAATAVSAALMCFALVSNLGFLLYCAKKRGLFFAIAATFFWFIDCIVVTTGAINGAGGYIAGKKY